MRKAVMVLLTLALAISVLAVVGCGNGGSSGSPEQVVETFLKAAKDGDADAAYAVISEESKAEIETKEQLVEGFSEGISDYKVGASTIEGDNAGVETIFSVQGMDMDLPFDFILIKEGGTWKISLPATEIEIQNAFQKLTEEFGPTESE